jgi:hypothetical protein
MGIKGQPPPRLPMPAEIQQQIAVQRASSGNGSGGRLSGTLRLPMLAPQSDGPAPSAPMPSPVPPAGPGQMPAPLPFGFGGLFGMGAPFGSNRPGAAVDPLKGTPRFEGPPGHEPKVHTPGGDVAGLLASLFGGKP